MFAIKIFILTFMVREYQNMLTPILTYLITFYQSKKSKKSLVFVLL